MKLVTFAKVGDLNLIKQNINKKTVLQSWLTIIEIIEIHEIHMNGWLPGPLEGSQNIVNFVIFKIQSDGPTGPKFMCEIEASRTHNLSFSFRFVIDLYSRLILLFDSERLFFVDIAF